MSRSKPAHDALSIVERCYSAATDDTSWMDDLLEAASSGLDLGPGLGLTLFREESSRAKVVLSRGVGGISKWIQLSWPLLESMRGENYRRFFYPEKPVTFASPIAAEFSAPLKILYDGLLRTGGVSDLLGMLGYPAPGWMVTMFLGVGRDRKVDPQVRATLHRVRIHIESGFRLRLLRPEQAVAVLSPAGALLHLDEQRAEGQRENLESRVRSIEHARTRKQRQGERALETWTALVEGRWSLVERSDRDGKRHYYAYENSPYAHAYRTLTPGEAAVLDQSIQGQQGKYVSYATGLSSSRVSEYLASAALKLGFRNRADLLRVASALRMHGRYNLLSAELTEAERDVWRLVGAGLSNAEIAAARRSSVRTVVNQVASLFKKTGATSRRGLIVAIAETETADEEA